MQDTVWVTKDGKHLLVSRMETSHIRNCIAKIERSRRGWRKQYLERLKLELEIRSMGERT
jgi:hypothetical protein